MRTGLIRNIKTYLSVAKLKDNTPDILSMFGADSFDELSDEELQTMCAWSYEAYTAYTSANSYTKELSRVRSWILKCITGSPDAKKEEEKGMGYSNENIVINRFVLHQRKKVLYMMSYDELISFHKGVRRMMSTGHVSKSWKAKNENDKKEVAMPLNKLKISNIVS